MRKAINVFLFLTFILILASFFTWHRGYFGLAEEENNNANNEKVASNLKEKKDKIVKIPITANSTYGELMAQASTSPTLANEIYNIAKPAYDLVKIRQGREIELTFDKDTDELKQLLYKVDSEDELIVKKAEAQGTSTPNTPNWEAKVIPIPYEVKIKIAQGEVKSSMYQAAIDNDIDIRAIIALADVFEYTIDFAMDPRVGDTFKFVYEERYLDGEYVMPGKILGGYYINDGEKSEVYYFEESADNKGYFDGKGNAVQKMFLKAPVSFRYISSGYTTGPRYVAAFKQYNSSHMAVDYAAAYGTPIRAVGNGTITSAGRKSGYGNSITLRHNETYTTTYSHLSKFAVKRGQKVSQGQIIGYVGSTGYSTGPHLHYEMIKNGVKVNPLKQVTPPGKPIRPENKDRFNEEMTKYQEMMK